ncbi:glycoside hydrolase family 6 protein [Streptomyces sp. NPDC051940]|uniref:glycoside hydrolase family 6 protein n=1 Tax=Streptomyces sp. NPDC051940 TaxID=3155675 RepID=UPI00344A43BA
MSGRTLPTALISLALIVAAAPTTGCSTPGEPDSVPAAAVRSPVRSPAIGAEQAAARAVRNETPFWADPDSDAARQVRDWEAAGRAGDARLLRRIAEQPMAVWPSGDENQVGPEVLAHVQGAARAGRTAVLVAYNIPRRDCGQHSAGGAADRAAYQRWIGAFTDNIVGDDKALVVLEPDAVPHMEDGCTPKEYHGERQEMLGEAVRRLKERPGVKVYLDAGNSAWNHDTGFLARRMWESGIKEADGFSLNVSNFQTTDDSRRYGRELSKLLGGKHFVIDTSRNGNGPLADREATWCNPPGRALGTPPSTDTGDPLVDAYLWIKRPGDSDGKCRGGPAAGTWWPEYALGLARAAEENEREGE